MSINFRLLPQSESITDSGVIKSDFVTYVGPNVSPSLWGKKFCLEASVNVIRWKDKKEAMDSSGQESP